MPKRNRSKTKNARYPSEYYKPKKRTVMTREYYSPKKRTVMSDEYYKPMKGGTYNSMFERHMDTSIQNGKSLRSKRNYKKKSIQKKKKMIPQMRILNPYLKIGNYKVNSMNLII